MSFLEFFDTMTYSPKVPQLMQGAADILGVELVVAVRTISNESTLLISDSAGHAYLDESEYECAF